MRHGWKLGRNRHPVGYALVGVAVIAGTLVWLTPQASEAAKAPAAAAGYAAVQKVLEQRCYQCHGAQLQMKNVRLDTPQALKQHAQAVYQQVVVARTMPLNNATQITDAERALVGQWFQGGAQTSELRRGYRASQSGAGDTMTAPDYRQQPRAFLEHLCRAAVHRALPLHNTAAFLPPPPKGRTVRGAGKAGGAMAQAVEALWPRERRCRAWS